MGGETLREQLEAYAREKYRVEAEQLPFNHEDYAIFRHADSGKWFAVFVVKSRQSFGLPGDGDTEIICLKIRNPLLADMLTQQPGYLRGFPSSKWNWVSIVLDGTVPIEEICRWLDESYAATKTKAKNQKVPLGKKSERIKEERKRKMEIKAVKFRKDGFYGQPFAFGGEEGMDKFDKNVRYRGSLQNYLIDTGDEVILVDTGLPAGTPEEVPDENSPAYTGRDICSYMEAFAALGYKPEQVTKILLTHRHSDHSGELKSFPNAKIYVNADETSADELQGLNNIVPVTFTDGAYYNFPESQIIIPGVRLIKAKGHTRGNSIIIVENDGLFYMLHGDITYVDEALYADKLSTVFDDLAAARETQDRIRDFIRNHPTVYCGTHTPQGYENLEARRVMDLDNPVPTVYAEVDFSAREASGKYVCSICGYVYDPAEHDGVAFEELPEDWKCPRCRQPKEKFNKA